MDRPQDSRRKRPIVSLFSHIKDEEVRKRTMAAWEGSSSLFDQTLRKLIENKLQESYNAIDDEDVYNKPDRAGYLADQCGYRRALKEILLLLPTNT